MRMQVQGGVWRGNQIIPKCELFWGDLLPGNSPGMVVELETRL